MVIRKKSKLGKVYRKTDGQTDGRPTTGDQKSSSEHSVPIRYKVKIIIYEDIDEQIDYSIF